MPNYEIYDPNKCPSSSMFGFLLSLWDETKVLAGNPPVCL